MNALKKLSKARIQLQGMKLSKSGHNKFAGYYYFELGDFLPQIQEIFHVLGLVGVVSYGHDLATLTITDIEDGSEVRITSPMSTAALKGCHEVQNLGAVETYIRRYLWVTALEIVEHDALDATTEKPEVKRGKGVIKPTDGALESLSPDQQLSARDDAEYIIRLWDDDDKGGALEAWNTVGEGDNTYKIAVWACMSDRSDVRNGIKKLHKEQA